MSGDTTAAGYGTLQSARYRRSPSPGPFAGDRGTTVSRDVIAFLRQKKIAFEVLPTEQAAATFNFLNLERRCVAGALIPPVDVRLMDRDYEQQLKSQRQALLEEP